MQRNAVWSLVLISWIHSLLLPHMLWMNVGPARPTDMRYRPYLHKRHSFVGMRKVVSNIIIIKGERANWWDALYKKVHNAPYYRHPFIKNSLIRSTDLSSESVCLYLTIFISSELIIQQCEVANVGNIT